MTPNEVEEHLQVLYKALNNSDPIQSEQREIARIGLKLFKMLLEKNLRYGNSATHPLGVFSKISPIEGIHIRMDDKLKRIQTGAADDDEDPIFDLAGYCILEIIARRSQSSGS